ncbi:pentapeptide repeat-containing protein [Streptomyces sp. NPDC005303]|uniref:pentapeptide repeat-containing protein n=1 Tax=Streptomyces sp. NPDC005303 TaxID=3155713 RepID=UPI0033BCCCA2
MALIVGLAVSTTAALGSLATTLVAWPQLDQVERQLELSRQGQITDRFNDAVQNMGSDKLGVRLGAVLALQRIMEDSERDQPATIYVLAGFLRDGSPTSAKRPAGDYIQKADMQAAFEILAKRASNDDNKVRVDLSRTRLGETNVSEAKLSEGEFEWADWAGVKLPSADLHGSNCSHAVLKNSHLEGADLRNSVLRGAKLDGAILHQADMRDTDLRETELAGVDLSEADLRGADIYPAKLPGSYLVKADMRGLDLSEADLDGADISGADLRNADLRNVDLNKVTMSSSTQLKGAEIDPEDERLAKNQVDDI